MNVNTEHSVLHSPDTHTCLHSLEFIIFCILLGYKHMGRHIFIKTLFKKKQGIEKKALRHMKKDLEPRIKTDGIS